MAVHAYGTYGGPPFSTNNHGTRITQGVFDNLLRGRTHLSTGIGAGRSCAGPASLKSGLGLNERQGPAEGRLILAGLMLVGASQVVADGATPRPINRSGVQMSVQLRL